MENECYEEEDQPYRKTDYKPIIYITSIYYSAHFLYISVGANSHLSNSNSFRETRRAISIPDHNRQVRDRVLDPAPAWVRYKHTIF